MATPLPLRISSAPSQLPHPEKTHKPQTAQRRWNETLVIEVLAWWMQIEEEPKLQKHPHLWVGGMSP